MSVILVIDEHRVYRSSIRELIETRVHGAQVVEASPFEFSSTSQCFDLVLVDAGSLSSGFLALLKEAHKLSPATYFAVMSTSSSRADVLNYLSAGFHGFVNKLQSDAELVVAIGELLHGRIYVPRWIVDGHDCSPDISFSTNTWLKALKLTRRQNEILPLIAQGMSNKEIARLLDIAEGTTKIHTAGLLHALGARNRTEAAFIAARLVGHLRTKRIQDVQGERPYISSQTGPTRDD